MKSQIQNDNEGVLYYKQMLERLKEHYHCLEIANKRKMVELQRKVDELRYQKMRD